MGSDERGLTACFVGETFGTDVENPHLRRTVTPPAHLLSIVTHALPNPHGPRFACRDGRRCRWWATMVAARVLTSVSKPPLRRVEGDSLGWIMAEAAKGR